MQITMYDAFVPAATRMLTNLSVILDKGAAFAAKKEIEPTVLTGSRLAPDMFPLSRQVQIACDITKGGAARLTKSEIPKYEDTETTFPELKARIDKTLAFVKSLDADKYKGSEDREVVLQTRRGDLKFDGLTYLRDFVLPNIHFHVTAAYLILRHNGVEVGKADYLGG